MNALKERPQAVLNDDSIDERSRAILRHALETNDPWLAEMVLCADADEPKIDAIGFEETSETNEDDSGREKIETLIGMICGAGGEASSALLVLMAMFQNSADPNTLANTAKHLAFTYCGELNVNGIVDTQAALFEGELLRGTGLHSERSDSVSGSHHRLRATQPKLNLTKGTSHEQHKPHLYREDRKRHLPDSR